MIVAYHAIMVEIHDNGQMQVRLENGRIGIDDGRTTKVIDGGMSAPLGSPSEAAEHLGRAANILSEQLAQTPILPWANAQKAN